MREIVKWDYELRAARPDGDAVRPRAFELAMAEPRGPVYLTLPREMLAAAPPANGDRRDAGAAAAACPTPQAIARRPIWTPRRSGR